MMTAEVVETREHLEAECRQQMALVSRMPRRGWDDERRRQAELRALDALLDDFNESGPALR